MRVVGKMKSREQTDDLEIIDCDSNELCFDSLPKDHQYDLGLDPSTKSTGLSIISRQTNEVYFVSQMMNSIFKKPIPRYVSDIVLVILNIRDCLELVHIYIEGVPPIYDSSGHTHEVLTKLFGELWNSLVAMFDEENIFSILPPSWQSKVYIKDKQKNSSMRSKEYMAKCVIQRITSLDSLYNYLQKIEYHDYDAFDSAGLILGGRQYIFDEDGARRNIGNVRQTHQTHIAYFYITEEEIRPIFKTIMKLFPQEYLVMRTYNTEKSVYQNLVMAGVSEKATMMQLDEPTAINSFLVEYNVMLSEEKILIALIFGTMGGTITVQQSKNIISNLSKYYKTIYPNEVTY